MRRSPSRVSLPVSKQYAITQNVGIASAFAYFRRSVGLFLPRIASTCLTMSFLSDELTLPPLAPPAPLEPVPLPLPPSLPPLLCARGNISHSVPALSGFVVFVAADLSSAPVLVCGRYSALTPRYSSSSDSSGGPPSL